MKTIILTALVAIFSPIKAQTTMELTGKQKSLITIAALSAKGDIKNLETALDNSLDNGLTANEAKEALSHIYAYVGFPRSLNALGALERVLKLRDETGRKYVTGKDSDPLPEGYDALVEGTRVQTQLVGGNPFDYKFAPQTDYYLKAHLFGDIFARNVLTFAEREMVTISAISALEGCEAQLRSHVSGSRNMGVDNEQLRLLPQVIAENVSGDCALRAKRAVEYVLDNKTGDSPSEPDFNTWPRGELNTAYAKYFIGNSYLAPMDAQNGGPVNVTFEPRCRNNWHIHHQGVQVLICVSGRGWYQEWGKDPVEMRPGTVIAIPSDVKHWHGAAKDAWFQHLTYMTKTSEETSTEWLEPVGDDYYNTLP